MKFETREGEKRAVLLLMANKDLPRIRIGGEEGDSMRPDSGVFFDVIEEKNHRLSVTIKLDEHTTSAELKKAIPIALEWRNRLNEYQGFNWEWGTDRDLYDLEQKHRAGKSYGELADEMNARIEREFRRSLGEILAGASKDWFTEELGNYEPWRTHGPIPEHTRNFLGLGLGMNLLWAMGYQEDGEATNGKQKRKRPNKQRVNDILDVFFHALAHYKKGLPLFEKGFRLDGPRIEATLKAFRRSKEYRIIQHQMQEAKPKRKRSGKN